MKNYSENNNENKHFQKTSEKQLKIKCFIFLIFLFLWAKETLAFWESVEYLDEKTYGVGKQTMALVKEGFSLTNKKLQRKWLQPLKSKNL